MGSTRTGSRGTTEEVELLAELLVVRQRLQELKHHPAVSGANRLARTFGPLLEPVWDLLALSEEATGVGSLLQYGVASPTDGALEANASVARKATKTYRRLRLTGPDRHQVWAVMSNPTSAILANTLTPAVLPAVPSTGTTAGLRVAVRPTLPRALQVDWNDDADVVPALRRLLCRWCDLARASDSVVGDVARIMLAAALLARGAALDGDTDTVRWFIDRWLRLAPTEARLDGSTAALLENDWTRNRVDSRMSVVMDTVTALRADGNHQHRLHRPVWETRLGGAPVTLMSEHGPNDGWLNIRSQGEYGDPLELISADMISDDVAAVLGTLPELPREILIATHLRGMSLKEISDSDIACGLGTATIRAMLARAIKTVQRNEHRVRFRLRRPEDLHQRLSR
ncbi:hypothetical protein AB0O91_36855 [Kitasatospora sp. NPDC089797]|uniref:hypothetical protein n=1 Tax=Kitasatospora sp. NPDC089797 TaxID=3155298 RepID=UPI003437A1FC